MGRIRDEHGIPLRSVAFQALWDLHVLACFLMVAMPQEPGPVRKPTTQCAMATFAVAEKPVLGTSRA